jgi:hypothetical protein
LVVNLSGKTKRRCSVVVVEFEDEYGVELIVTLVVDGGVGLIVILVVNGGVGLIVEEE